MNKAVPKCIRPKAKVDRSCTDPVNPTVCECSTRCICACVACGKRSSHFYLERLKEMAKKYKKEHDAGQSPSLVSFIDEIEQRWPRRLADLGFRSIVRDYNALPTFEPTDAIVEEGGDEEFEFLVDTEAGKLTKRSTTGELRPLLHYQVSMALEEYTRQVSLTLPMMSKYMRNMVPVFLGVEEDEDRERGQVVYYTERVEDVSLIDAIGLGIQEVDLRMTMLVIHSMLNSFKSIGFVHGSLRFDKVILRGYGAGEEYPVPILVNGVGHIVILPFLPTLVDFDTASTQRYSSHLASLSPYTNEMSDVVMMYSQLDLELPHNHPFREASRRIDRALGEGWRQAKFIPALPLHFPDLTHESMMGLYLEE